MARGAALSLLSTVLLSLGLPAQAVDSEPDVAYDESNDIYLVVWMRQASGQPDQVFGEFMSPNGTRLRSLPRVPAADAAAPREAQLTRARVRPLRSRSLHCASLPCAIVHAPCR